MGSSTYEFILGHDWPYGDRPSWVLTSRELPVAEGADVRFHDGPVADIHPEMVAAAGDATSGWSAGARWPPTSPTAGLLDELWVTVVPIVLGSGKPLFSSPIERAMRLLGTRTFEDRDVRAALRLGQVARRYDFAAPPE